MSDTASERAGPSRSRRCCRRCRWRRARRHRPPAPPTWWSARRSVTVVREATASQDSLRARRVRAFEGVPRCIGWIDDSGPAGRSEWIVSSVGCVPLDRPCTGRRRPRNGRRKDRYSSSTSDIRRRTVTAPTRTTRDARGCWCISSPSWVPSRSQDRRRHVVVRRPWSSPQEVVQAPFYPGSAPDPGPRRRRAGVGEPSAAGPCPRSPRRTRPPSRSSGRQPGARRPRHQPGDEARPAVPPGPARDRDVLAAKIVRDAGDGRPSSSRPSRWRHPGSSTCASRRRALEALVDGILAEPDRLGRVAPSGRASVNVEFVSANPTGPLTIGNARGAFVGDLLCRVLEAGGQRVTREYYFNDSGGQVEEPRRVGRRHPARRAGPRGRLPRARTSTTSPPRSRTMSGRPRRADGADAPRIVGHWAAGRVRAGIEASLAAPRRPLRRLDERGLACTRRAGSSGRSSDCAAGGHVYEQDGATWFRSTTFGDDKDRVIYPLQRRADVLRGRHRLRHREVQPRLRPPDLHLGRRPPRHGRAGPQRRRGDGLRPRARSRCCCTRGCASCATAARSR